MSHPEHPAILIVIDGFAINPKKEGNAVKAAKMPNFQKIWDKNPHTTLETKGLSVGLPEGQMGNSEVGHMNIGAGRVVFQDLTRIDESIRDRSFFSNQTLIEAFKKAKDNSGRVHLYGLVSDGGVHSHIGHIFALIEMAKREKVKELYLHACLDGRDTPPKSAKEYMSQVEAEMKKTAIGSIATINGRFYGMDRDRRWERTEAAYLLLTEGKGFQVKSASDALDDAYKRGETDEFVQPTLINKKGLIKDGDVIIFFNFRADRMRQIVKALAEKQFEHFKRSHPPKLAYVATMTSYHKDYSYPVIFSPVELKNILGAVLSNNKLKQLRIAETEKYAHVTFFFNGGVDKPYKCEERILIQSPKDVKTYDLKPEMSAYEVTKTLVDKMKSKEFRFIVVNFANPDMVGHSGAFDPTVKALEVVDECLGQILSVIEKDKWIAIITSDHGNSDQLIDYATGGPMTAHTLHPVPLIIIDPDGEVGKLRKGKLADIAPTILELLNIKKPDEMTGDSLIK
ncbi:MAG: phosphoglycerate mutase (2,3-diphosphoglycerate-independent) [Deltaproteobacteria bacterium RIFCSPHIGHO2_12_FULL_43_9]|nr:MAG: phosphoglycerate mutase (2,3-diphosphoglycerate-independent) [Deltaproteobacteria bacterium RIFCSPHIGHO2_12_FULL_43_9]